MNMTSVFVDGGQRYAVGSTDSVVNIAKKGGWFEPPFDENHVEYTMQALGGKRRDIIDCMSVGTYDASMSTANKVAEMDSKLDKICKKLDIEA